MGSLLPNQGYLTEAELQFPRVLSVQKVFLGNLIMETRCGVKEGLSITYLGKTVLKNFSTLITLIVCVPINWHC